MQNYEFIIKLVMEAGVVGGIAITVIRFLMHRIVNQLDEDRSERRLENRQLSLWMIAQSRTLLLLDRTLILHDANVFGINTSIAENQNERNEIYERRVSPMIEKIDDAVTQLSKAATEIEKSIQFEQQANARRK